ncbi:MAG: S8 family peptidase [Coriobacteriia bacterium]|nr:S8 family peptidase [Coriobacteriia bacterium]
MAGDRTRIALLSVLVFVLVTALPAAGLSAGDAPVRTIVVFDEGVRASALVQIAAPGAVKVKDLPLVNGAVFWLPSRASQRAVARLAGVRYVESDVRAYASVKPPKISPTQSLPWGIDRINADEAWAITTGDPVKVAIVDTGIDTTHPDLAANVMGGMSAVNYTRKYTDDNGHGTHVAGIVAALDNSIGVVGVGPDIDLYAVKVLNRKGSGYISDIIEGLDWCQSAEMDVVNMSLGTGVYLQSFHDAVNSLYESGVVVVAAAGNDGNDSAVNYPAAFPEVIAVGATTQTDTLAYFTCTGPEVELSAPGSNIYSTYKNGGYATLSGTSMASPHVTGAAALVLTRPIDESEDDGDRKWDPAEVRARLRAKAEDLGIAGRDPGFGYGLVRADLAIVQ